jgi:Protein kinase domain
MASRKDRMREAVQEFLTRKEEGDGVDVASFISLDAYVDLAPDLEIEIVESWADPKIDGFELLYRIGIGAFGEVHIAREKSSGVFRAVKIVRLVGQRDIDIRGVTEAVCCMAGRHEAEYFNLPTYGPAIGQDRAGRFFYYVMDLADGMDNRNTDWAVDGRYSPRTLSEIIRSGPLSAKETLRLGESLARGVVALHDSGRGHFDIKPSNVLKVGGKWKIGDLGLIEKVSNVDGFRGTGPYLMPGAESVDLRHDVYAIGKVLFQAHRQAKAADAHALLNYTTDSSLQSTDEKALQAIVKKTCAGRCQSAVELLQDLMSAIEGEKSQVTDGSRSVLSRSAFWFATLIIAVLTGFLFDRFIYSPSVPDFSGEWEYECAALDKEYSHGGTCLMEARRSQYGVEFKIIGQRKWRKIGKGDREEIEFVWHNSWGLITGNNSLRFEYSVERPEGPIFGYGWAHIEFENGKPKRVKGNFYQVPPIDPLFGRMEFKKK